MKKKILYLALGMSLLLLAGCFQSHRVITVNKDGSGTIVETFLVSTEMGISAGDHDPEKLKLRAYGFGEDVKYESSKKIEKGILEGNEAIYSFDDIAKVRIAEDALGELMENGSDYLHFNFKKGETAELEILMPHTISDEVSWEDLENETIDEAEMNSALEMVRGMCSDLEVSTKIVMNGKISNTDAGIVNGNEITLQEIMMKDVLTDSKSMLLMKQLQQSNPAKMKDLVVDFPGIKIETKEKIKVKFK